MEKFIDYIESQMSGVPDGPFLYKFKRKTLDEMNGRVSEVEARGLRDKKCDRRSHYQRAPGS